MNYKLLIFIFANNLLFNNIKDCIYNIYYDMLNKDSLNNYKHLLEINYNKINLIYSFTKNFNILPSAIQTEILKCQFNNTKIIEDLDSKYNHNYYQNNPFTFTSNCPTNYMRINNSTLCDNNNIKSSSNKDNILTENNCFQFESYFISEKEYEIESECLEENFHCKKETKDNKTIYKPDCPKDYKNVLSLCVPLCKIELENNISSQNYKRNIYNISETIIIKSKYI